MIVNPFSKVVQDLITVTEITHQGQRAVLATVAWPKGVRGSAQMMHAAALIEGLAPKTRELGKTFKQEMVPLLVSRQPSAGAAVSAPRVKHFMIFQ